MARKKSPHRETGPESSTEPAPSPRREAGGQLNISDYYTPNGTPPPTQTKPRRRGPKLTRSEAARQSRADRFTNPTTGRYMSNKAAADHILRGLMPYKTAGGKKPKKYKTAGEFIKKYATRNEQGQLPRLIKIKPVSRGEYWTEKIHDTNGKEVFLNYRTEAQREEIIQKIIAFSYPDGSARKIELNEYLEEVNIPQENRHRRSYKTREYAAVFDDFPSE